MAPIQMLVDVSKRGFVHLAVKNPVRADASAAEWVVISAARVLSWNMWTRYDGRWSSVAPTYAAHFP